MLCRELPIAQPLSAMARRTVPAQYRQYLPMCQSEFRGCGNCRVSHVSQRPESTLCQRHDPHLHKRHAQACRTSCPSRYHQPYQPHLLLRIPQWFASHTPSPTGRHPQPVSQKRMDRRSSLRRVCRGLQLVVKRTL